MSLTIVQLLVETSADEVQIVDDREAPKCSRLISRMQCEGHMGSHSETHRRHSILNETSDQFDAASQTTALRPWS